jgi:DNA-binding transcriptional regulator YiaG
MPLSDNPLRVKQPTIGKLVRALRQEMKLSQQKFAAEFGVTFPTVNRWENGKAMPSPLARQRIDSLLEQLGAQGEILRSAYLSSEEGRND